MTQASRMTAPTTNHHAPDNGASFVPGGNMSSLDYTTEELAERNGARLLAMQLQTLQLEYNESARRHFEELHRIRLELTEAQKIGLRVLSARDRGRKTVRIDALVNP